MLRLKDVCQLKDGEKKTGKGICLDAKYLRGKSSSTIIEKGKFVYTGDNIILVDGENSGEVWIYGQYIQTAMVFFDYVETLYLGFYPILQRGVTEFKKRCGNSTPQ